MDRIEVIFIDMPTMVRQMLNQAVASQPDMTVAAEVAEPAEALAALAGGRRGVVLVGDTRLGGRTVETLLRAAPDTTLLAVAASGDELDLYELRPTRVRLGEASPERVVEAIREHGRRRGKSA